MAEYPFDSLLGIHDIKDEAGVAAPRRNVINFAGATVADDSAQRETVVTFDATNNSETRLSPTSALQLPNSNVDTYVLAAAQTVYGLGAPSLTEKTFAFVVNVSGSAITLEHESASAGSAADRFVFASASNYSLPDKGILFLWYDRTAARWRGF